MKAVSPILYGCWCLLKFVSCVFLFLILKPGFWWVTLYSFVFCGGLFRGWEWVSFAVAVGWEHFQITGSPEVLSAFCLQSLALTSSLCVSVLLLARDAQVARASSSAATQVQSLVGLGCLVEVLKLTVVASLLGAPYQVGMLSLDCPEQDLHLRPTEPWLSQLSCWWTSHLTGHVPFLLGLAWQRQWGCWLHSLCLWVELNWLVWTELGGGHRNSLSPGRTPEAAAVLQYHLWRSAPQFRGGFGWFPECGEWWVLTVSSGFMVEC